MDIDQLVTSAKDAITVRRIFGEPHHYDGVTVIPAAAVIGGLGGGSGTDERGQDGQGGGFGLIGRPVGAYIIMDGDVSWKPVFDPARILTVMASLAVAYLLARRPQPHP